MDLIYYYSLEDRAPSNVARNVFEHLIKREEEIPYNLKIFARTKDQKKIRESFDNIEIITIKNVHNSLKNCIVHIPVYPTVFPNSKFVLNLLAKFKKKKLILNCHGDLRKELLLKWKQRYQLNIFPVINYIAYPYILKGGNQLIVNSHLMSESLKSKYDIKSIVIPNAIEDFWFDESEKGHIELDGDPNIFYHGRLSSEKGVDILIKGLSKAVSERSNVKLYIAADGQQHDYLKKLCIKCGIEKNVIFLGRIDKKTIKSYLENVDAAIYPSICENFPLSYLEAFSSCRGPVYYSSFAGINDFVVGDGYKLNAFEPKPENISMIVNEIISGNFDRRVVKQQKEFASKYTWNIVTKQYLEIYQKI